MKHTTVFHLRAALACVLMAAVAVPYPTEARQRSKTARSAFKHTHPCPSTGKASGRCPGYVIDHRTALDCGGADSPWNMQWQTVEAARQKDRWERTGVNCNHRTR